MLTARCLTGAQFENCPDIGVFTRLTNGYCLMAEGGAETYRCAGLRFRAFVAHGRHTPDKSRRSSRTTSLSCALPSPARGSWAGAACAFLRGGGGLMAACRLTVGNSRGLLLPTNTTDQVHTGAATLWQS